MGVDRNFNKFHEFEDFPHIFINYLFKVVCFAIRREARGGFPVNSRLC
jgi:hypothetical protein